MDDDIESCFESTLEGVTHWDQVDLGLPSDEEEEDMDTGTDQVHRWALSRQYITLYGCCPVVESKIYSLCDMCGLVFNPRNVSKHRELCTDKGLLLSQLQSVPVEGSSKNKHKHHDNEEENNSNSNPSSWKKVRPVNKQQQPAQYNPKVDTKNLITCKLCGQIYSSQLLAAHRLTCTGVEEAITTTTSTATAQPTASVTTTPAASGTTVKVKTNNSKYPIGQVVSLPKSVVSKQKKLVKYAQYSQSVKKKVKNKKNVHENIAPLPPVFNRESQSWPTLSSKLPKFILYKKAARRLRKSRAAESKKEDGAKTSTSGSGSGGPCTRSISQSNYNKCTQENAPLPPVFNRESQSWSAISTKPSKITLYKKAARKLRKSRSASDSKLKEETGKASTSGVSSPRAVSDSSEKVQSRKSASNIPKNAPTLSAKAKFTVLDHQPLPPISSIQSENKCDEVLMQEIVIQEAEEEEEEAEIVVMPEHVPQVLQEVKVYHYSQPNEICTAFLQSEQKEEVFNWSEHLTVENGYCILEKKTTSMLVFRPISPIFVVTPVQFVQKENTVFVEADADTIADNAEQHNYFLPIPEGTTNIKLYTTHPKPTVLPTYGARKIGGAILSSNQRLEYQLKDIQAAISNNSTSSCKTAS